MKRAKQHLVVSLTIFAVAFVAVVVFTATSASGAFQTMSEAIEKANTPEIIPVESSVEEIQPRESVSEEPEQAETYTEPFVTPKSEQQQQETPQLERIEFTNKPVIAGEPESYIDTYGQCPFYENAGPKGCVPPPYIECNDDWSQCKIKEEINE